MRVYYMTSHKVAAEHILPERRMKLSLFDDLNDPFELLPFALSAGETRTVSRALRESIAQKKGVICFSDNWRSPVMWAHYADKHRGVCLGFDVPYEGPEGAIRNVDYTPARLKLELNKQKEHLGLDQATIRTLLYTKSAEWAYEREWRVLSNLEVQDPETGYYFVSFGEHLQLREVILGAKNGVPVGQVAKLIKGNAASVKVFKARAAFHEFAMVTNQAVAPIRVNGRKGAETHVTAK